MDNKGITTLVIALTIGAVFFIPVVDIINSNSGTQTINDSVVTDNASFTETYNLEGYDIVAGSETIEANDGTGWVTLTSGTDYVLTDGSAELELNDTANVNSGDEIRATYDYAATGGMVTSITGLLPVFLALILLVPMANRVSEGV